MTSLLNDQAKQLNNMTLLLGDQAKQLQDQAEAIKMIMVRNWHGCGTYSVGACRIFFSRTYVPAVASLYFIHMIHLLDV